MYLRWISIFSDSESKYVKHTKLSDFLSSQISPAMMHVIIIGCSGAIAMNLTVCKKQVEKQWRKQVAMITVHKFSYLKRVDLINVSNS